MKDKADILCVYCSGEVVEEWLATVSPLTAERLHQERLEEAEHGHLSNQVTVFLKRHVYERVHFLA